MTASSQVRREDGTCWTCAKPRCFGAFGHTVGRLRWAVITAWYARPRTLSARLRLLWSDFVRHGLLHRHDGEQCQDCGRGYPLWSAPRWLWQRVVGDMGGLLCPTCFDRRAREIGMRVEYTAAAWKATQ